MGFTPATMILALLAMWLHLIFSCTASPAGIPPSPTTSIGLNPAVAVTGIETVIAYPKSRDELEKLDREVRAIIIKGKVTVLFSEHGIERKGIICWFVEAEAEEVQRLKSNVAGVDVEKDEDIIEPADFSDQDSKSLNAPSNASSPDIELINAVVRQTTAPPDLRVLSWPPGENFQSLNSYAYEANSARDTYIYVIDRGLDPYNSEFSGMPFQPDEWFYGFGIQQDQRTDDHVSSHGSCVASKAAGVINGVSKRSHIVMLKIDNSSMNVVWGFSKANDDIVNKNRQGRAVIAYANTAKTPTPEGFPGHPWANARGFISDLFKNDVVVVVPSGNYARDTGRSLVDTLPATLESADNPKFPLIVAGAVDNLGSIPPFSQGPNHVTAWAPGLRVRCAARGHRTAMQTLSGTSFSTGTIAGFIAYTLGLRQVPFQVGQGETALNAKYYLQEDASWQRMANGPNVVWNKQNGAAKFSTLNVSTS